MKKMSKCSHTECSKLIEDVYKVCYNSTAEEYFFYCSKECFDRDLTATFSLTIHRKATISEVIAELL